MRSVLLFAFAVAMSAPALAADPAEDMPYLRGSNAYEPPAYKTYTRWAGWYAGGHVEYASAHVDFTRATRSLVSFSLRELALESEQHVSSWEVLGRHDTNGTGFGGFIGYNTQWEDVVLGLEASYNRNSFTAVAPNYPLGRLTAAGGNTYGVMVSGSGTLRMIDYGTVRARAGWVFGSIMPYATVGFALGRVDFTRSATVTGTETNGSTVTPFTFVNSEAKDGAFVPGWALGAGIDWCVFGNLFVRGEVEYVGFAPISGIAAHLVAGRLGAGWKF